jgi:hypothetical protein
MKERLKDRGGLSKVTGMPALFTMSLILWSLKEEKRAKSRARIRCLGVRQV